MSSRDLWVETILQLSMLQKLPSQENPCGFRLQRLCRLLTIELSCQVGKEEKQLVSADVSDKHPPHQRITTKMFHDESLKEALGRCMFQTFGLTEAACRTHLEITDGTREEVRDSSAFPGLV